MANYDDTATVSGSVVSIENGADEVGAKSCVVTVRPTLSGVSLVTETQTGESLANIADVSGSMTNAYFYNIGSDFVLTAGTTYKIVMEVNSTVTPFAVSVGVGDNAYRYDIYNTGINNKNGVVAFEFTVNASHLATWNKLWIRAPRYSAPSEPATPTTCTFTVKNITLYTSATVYTASLGRTIYGGTPDIVNGVGSEDCVRLDLGLLTWANNASYANVFNGTLPSGYIGDTTTDFVCEVYENANSTSVINLDMSIAFNYGRTVLYCHDNRFSTAEDFKNAVQGVHIVYKCTAKATDFTFTGQEIPTRLGYNAFWSEQGDTELTYYKSGYGFTSVTVHKETPEGEPVVQTTKFHRIVYGGQADVVKGTCEPKNLISPPEYTANTPSLCLDLGEDKTFDSVTLSFLATNTVVNSNVAAIVDYRKNDGTHQYRTLANFKNEGGVTFAKQTPNSGRFRNSYISVSGITFRYVYIYYEYNTYSYISTDSMSEWQLELGSTASEYVPHFDPFTFPPISIGTDEGENTLFANEGDSAITYRKAVD